LQSLFIYSLIVAYGVLYVLQLLQGRISLRFLL
jgi:hypothetical protein